MDVRAIARRVVRLEGRLIPQEDPEANRIVELLRKRRLARLREEREHEDRCRLATTGALGPSRHSA
jgi:hypothetical protein